MGPVDWLHADDGSAKEGGGCCEADLGDKSLLGRGTGQTLASGGLDGRNRTSAEKQG